MKLTTEHKIGPWMVTLIKPSHAHVSSTADGFGDICTVWSSGYRVKDRVKDHANLIAAAPELYEALQQLSDECDEYVRINNLHNGDGTPATTHSMLRARAALAKARGGQ